MVATKLQMISRSGMWSFFPESVFLLLHYGETFPFLWLYCCASCPAPLRLLSLVVCVVFFRSLHSCSVVVPSTFVLFPFSSLLIQHGNPLTFFSKKIIPRSHKIRCVVQSL